jgi:formate C-acetyltransferase
MDEYAAAHPEASPVQLKAAQYEILAEGFQPVLFRNSPLFSEMGVKVAEYDGVPGLGAGGWLYLRNEHLFYDADPRAREQYLAAGSEGLHLRWTYADYDHHCFPFSNVVEHGLEYFYRQAETELERCATEEETEFVQCALRGLLAVKKIAEKFAAAAAAQLEETSDATQRRFLRMIASTAREVPWRRSGTFCEGLCAMWFLHEVCASIEGLGMSVLGHLDRTLGPLYRADLEAGRLTPEEAYDLLCRFLLHTECKLDLDQPVDQCFNLQEQGDTLILGGCDENGSPVCNEVTFMVLRAHHELGLIYPKLLCRIRQTSPQEYLDAVNRDFLSGRNVIAFLNDDCLLPALVKAGKRVEDARRYVAGGCWETILEGFEHSAGANCYFNLARVLDLSVHESPGLEARTGCPFQRLDGAQDFEAVYRIVMGNVLRALRLMCSRLAEGGRAWPQVNPAPFFSACLADCLHNHRDYTAGGGRYNPHGLPLAGFSVLVDSLLVLRELCFQSGRHTLEELLTAVRDNWEGHEALRVEALTMPHYGDECPESNALARRVLDDIYAGTRDLENERGGPFQLGIYSYRDALYWAQVTRATPDGRRAGDHLSQGLTPSRLRPSAEITATINSAAALDLSQCPANSLLTLSLPLGRITVETLGHLERAFAASGIGMLQMNCIDQAQLLDACEHPERHRDLIVRVYGYSTRFVNLTKEMQEEFLTRTLFT